MVGAVTLGDQVDGVVLRQFIPHPVSHLFQEQCWLLTIDDLNVCYRDTHSYTIL